MKDEYPLIPSAFQRLIVAYSAAYYIASLGFAVALVMAGVHPAIAGLAWCAAAAMPGILLVWIVALDHGQGARLDAAVYGKAPA